MPTVERYSSFEEMDEAQSKDQAKAKPVKAKKQNTIKAFAALLRKNVITTTKPKRNTNSK